ncbi:MAG: tRNA adenosine(34) deaminase TadA [Porticoccaceae bacterium]|nr:tRNA adenosine(34) deaminase TadA [Porticoccaceae bacterium]
MNSPLEPEYRVPAQDEDLEWMQRALSLARQAEREGEVPVGAVIVDDGELLAEGWNSPLGGHDPTNHAEIVALRKAAAHRQNYRLPGATLYVTLEPCIMCVGAMIHARIERLVFAATEPRAGAVVSQLSLLEEGFFNHRIRWTEGVLKDPCGSLLSDFFKAKRAAR